MAELGEKIAPGAAVAGFVSADFDAYEEKKWSSNKFTLERRKVKDKLVALAKSVQEKLAEELAGLELLASDEAPSIGNGRRVDAQLVFFLRTAEERQALRTLVHTIDLQGGSEARDIALHHEHVSLVLKVDHKGLTVSLEVAGRAKVDRENAVEKLKQGWARQRLLELAKALPAGTQLGFEGERRPAEDVTADDVESWAADLLKRPASFGLTRFIERSDESLTGPRVEDVVLGLLRATLPIYRFVAWGRDNEHKQVKDAIKKASGERQKKAVRFQPGDRVTILTGLFAGRGGYLAEIDTKGRAKVMVGPVSVTIEVKDLKSA